MDQMRILIIPICSSIFVLVSRFLTKMNVSIEIYFRASDPKLHSCFTKRIFSYIWSKYENVRSCSIFCLSILLLEDLVKLIVIMMIGLITYIFMPVALAVSVILMKQFCNYFSGPYMMTLKSADVHFNVYFIPHILFSCRFTFVNMNKQVY